MVISAAWLVLNGAYLVYAASALFKDMLRLRVALLIATVLYIVYGAIAPNLSILLWNIPVGLVHTYAVWQLLLAHRGVQLDDEAVAVHTLLFPSLDRVAFNALWQCSHSRIAEDGEILISQGEPVDELSLIMDGEVDVLVDDKALVRLGHVRLIGEISSLRGTTATATVTALGTPRLRVWNKDALQACTDRFPDVDVALLKVMAHEVARKIH